jgi:hypothetical protein
MDSTTWIALIGIIGTLGGAGLGQWIALRSKMIELREQRLREDRNALLAGIRELHLSVVTFNISLADFTSKVLRSKAGLLSSEAKTRFDAADELLMPIHLPWAEMSSLQLLYANELGRDWLKLGRAHDALITATGNLVGDKISVADFQKAVNNLSDEAINFVGILTDKYLIISGDPFIHAKVRIDSSNADNSQIASG